MTEANRKLLVRIKKLLGAGLSQREIAVKLKVTPGRVHGIVYRYIGLVRKQS